MTRLTRGTQKKSITFTRKQEKPSHELLGRSPVKKSLQYSKKMFLFGPNGVLSRFTFLTTSTFITSIKRETVAVVVIHYYLNFLNSFKQLINQLKPKART